MYSIFMNDEYNTECGSIVVDYTKDETRFFAEYCDRVDAIVHLCIEMDPADTHVKYDVNTVEVTSADFALTVEEYKGVLFGDIRFDEWHKPTRIFSDSISDFMTKLQNAIIDFWADIEP